MFQRYNLPIGLVNRVERGLQLRVRAVSHQVFTKIRHFIQGNDASAHEYRLCHHDGACPQITGIGAKSVHDSLADAVESVGQSSELRLECLHERIARHAQLFEDALCCRRQRPQDVRHAVADL